MNKLIVPILILTMLFHSADLSARRGVPNFKWMKDVGAKSFPKAGKVFYAFVLGLQYKIDVTTIARAVGYSTLLSLLTLTLTA